MSKKTRSQTVQTVQSVRPKRLWLWFAWVIAFYAFWISFNFFSGSWSAVFDNWPIALAMALGSFVAGSTPMGGGTVGFPVLVLFFDLPAAMGRNFGLMIQSVGMTSAAIYIYSSNTPIETRILRWSILGAIVGLIVGLVLVAPLIPDNLVKLLFACVWMSFAVLTLMKNKEMCSFQNIPQIEGHLAKVVGIAVGVAGGITASLTGVGIDMILYTTLVLLFQCDLKVAVPTSVVIMAITSIMGTALNYFLGGIGIAEMNHWLSAAPIVILGAPAGAYLVNAIPRTKTLFFVSILCVTQFIWTLFQVKPNLTEWGFVGGTLLLGGIGLHTSYCIGQKRARSKSQDPANISSAA